MIHRAVQTAGDLLASTVVALLCTIASPAVAFGYAGAWMLQSLFATGTLRSTGTDR